MSEGGRFRCRGCGHRAAKNWRPYPCPKCGRWFDVKVDKHATDNETDLRSTTLVEKTPPMKHYPTGIAEFDLMVGGGLVLGRSVLIGGARGAGKTTISLQAACGFAREQGPALFCSGEMSSQELGEYLARLGLQHERLFVLGLDKGGTDVEKIKEMTKKYRAKFVVVDSLQTCIYDDIMVSAGSKSQVDAVANDFTQHASEENYALVILCHMNGQGDFAGGTKIQHLVHCLLFVDNLEPERDPAPPQAGMRKIFVFGKNRLGPASASAFLHMTDAGILETASPERIERWENFVASGGRDLGDEDDDPPPRHTVEKKVDSKRLDEMKRKWGTV